LPGKSPADALHRYLEVLQRTVSCVSREVLKATAYDDSRPGPYALTLGGFEPARLRGGVGISLLIAQQYTFVKRATLSRWQRWKVETARYDYALHDSTGAEIIAYHWHPGTWSGRPHLHVQGYGGPLADFMRKAHLPSGRVSVEEIIRCAIEEFGAEPLRTDWEAVLAESQTAFEKFRTWPISGN
jgi:hypothetical protein